MVWGVGIGCSNCIDKELLDTAVISGICGYNRPCSLTPTHAGPTSCALRNSPVNHNKTNSLFRSISRRVIKDVNGTVTKYCCDGDQVIAEYDGNDTLLRKFIYGPGIDEPIITIDVTDSNAVYYYHFDGLGSVAALSN